MKEILKQYALEKYPSFLSDDNEYGYYEDYNEDISDMEYPNSYIYKVGTLILADGNRGDWYILVIGYQSNEHDQVEIIGDLYFGDNSDAANVLKRGFENAFNSWHFPDANINKYDELFEQEEAQSKAAKTVHIRLCHELSQLSKKHQGEQIKDVPELVRYVDAINLIEEVYPTLKKDE